MKKVLFLVVTYMLCCNQIWAQRQEILSNDIQTLQVVAEQRWMSLPILDLQQGERVNIDFDDLTHEYHRYTYIVEHCESDWTVSDGVFESDYLDGFYNGLTIDDYQESLNTAQLYTHYHLELPNDHLQLKMSGNYRVTVMDENDDNQPVLRAYFMVVDRKMSVGMDMFTDTDIDLNHSHQQLNVKVNYNSVPVTDYGRQVKMFVMQNNRWETMRVAPRPQMTSRDGVQWQHCRDLIFPATNEYRKFEFLDIHRNSMGVDRTDFDGKDYHVWLYTDVPRPNYVYDETPHGAFYIRNTDNIENDTQSEYFVCHFTYKVDVPFDGDVFLDGQWTRESKDPQYRMEWDEVHRLYHCAVRMKMGYYSYQYVLRKSDGTTEYLPSDGNYYETRNEYTCLLYYRQIGGRTDLLYGVGEK